MDTPLLALQDLFSKGDRLHKVRYLSLGYFLLLNFSLGATQSKIARRDLSWRTTLNCLSGPLSFLACLSIV